MKKGLIVFLILLGTFLILIVSVVLILNYAPKSSESTLYTLPNYWDFPDNKPLTKEILAKHPYLQNIQQVSVASVLHNKEEAVIAKSDKSLNKENFLLLINDLIESGYIVDDGRDLITKIEEREVREDNDTILVIDKGTTTFLRDDSSLPSYNKETILEYKCDKVSGTIYFNAHR